MAGAVGVVVKIFLSAMKPNKIHDARISKLEEKVEQHDRLLGRDKDHFEELEKSNQITQRALLALLSHAIDGNNVQELKNAKDDLQNFLIGGK